MQAGGGNKGCKQGVGTRGARGGWGQGVQAGGEGAGRGGVVSVKWLGVVQRHDMWCSDQGNGNTTDIACSFIAALLSCPWPDAKMVEQQHSNVHCTHSVNYKRQLLRCCKPHCNGTVETSGVLPLHLWGTVCTMIGAFGRWASDAVCIVCLYAVNSTLLFVSDS